MLLIKSASMGANKPSIKPEFHVLVGVSINRSTVASSKESRGDEETGGVFYGQPKVLPYLDRFPITYPPPSSSANNIFAVEDAFLGI